MIADIEWHVYTSGCCCVLSILLEDREGRQCYARIRWEQSYITAPSARPSDRDTVRGVAGTEKGKPGISAPSSKR